MNNQVTGIALMACAVLGLNSAAHAAVVDFDGFDTSAAPYYLFVASGDAIGGGMKVSAPGATIVISETYSADWATGVSSSSNALGLSSGQAYESVFEMIDGSTFDFNGAYFTAIHTAQDVTLKGLVGGSVVFSQTVSLTVRDRQFLTADFASIDQLVIGKSGSSSWLGVDDLTINEPLSSVPVPAAAWLFGSALLGLIGRSRRRGS